MSFLEPIFLYFLPAALIPLILSLFYRMNRRKLTFPSLMLLEELMKNELSKRKLLFRLRQLLRALAVLLATLAYAHPVFRQASSRPVVVVIDPTLSMARFDIASTLTGLENHFNIQSIYFGDRRIDSETLSEGGNPGFDYRDLQMSDILRAVVAAGGTNVLLVTDGQSANFTKPFDGLRNLAILQLAAETRNLSVREISIFPGIGIQEVANRFTVKIHGDILPSDRLRIEMDGKEIYSGAASGTVTFDRFIEERGVHEIRAVMEGDEFTNDNAAYAAIVSVGKPSVYVGFDSPLLRRTLGVIFPELYFPNNPLAADVVIASSLANKVADKPVVLFAEDPDKLAMTLKRDYNVLIETAEGEISGDVESLYPALNAIGDVQLKTRFGGTFGTPVASAGSVPLAQRIGNYTVMNFSLKQNEQALESSAFLLFLMNEILMDGYTGNYFENGGAVAETSPVYDAAGNLYTFSDLKGAPGIYRLREDGKRFTLNVGAESDFSFLSRQELVNWNRYPVRWVEPEGSGRGGIDWGILLMLVAAALWIAELTLDKSK